MYDEWTDVSNEVGMLIQRKWGFRVGDVVLGCIVHPGPGGSSLLNCTAKCSRSVQDSDLADRRKAHLIRAVLFVKLFGRHCAHKASRVVMGGNSSSGILPQTAVPVQ